MRKISLGDQPTIIHPIAEMSEDGEGPKCRKVNVDKYSTKEWVFPFLGVEGWELVSSYYKGDGNQEFIFKRPLQVDTGETITFLDAWAPD